MSIDPPVAAPTATPTPRTASERRADAIALLADAVISAYIADDHPRRVAAPRDRSPGENEGEIALPGRPEEAVLSQPRGRDR